MLIKSILGLVACVASIKVVLPLMDAYVYVLVGILAGLVALLVAAYHTAYDHAPASIVGFCSLAIGAAVGLFWPAALGAAFAWITFGGIRDERSADA